jgi:hypothetical protein
LRLSLQLLPIASNNVFVHFIHPDARCVPQYGALQPVASNWVMEPLRSRDVALVGTAPGECRLLVGSGH